jgi:hypothetical protein
MRHVGLHALRSVAPIERRNTATTSLPPMHTGATGLRSIRARRDRISGGVVGGNIGIDPCSL